MSNEVTFIIGAGSSTNFGLPVGTKLYDEIIGDLTGWRSLADILNEISDIDAHAMSCNEIADSMKLSPLSSIDEFIHNYCAEDQNSEALLKVLIAKNILSLEDHQSIFNRKNDNWYRNIISYLIRNANKEYETISEQPINFVTFNYDRTLEWFLYHGILSTFPKAQENKVKYNEWFKKYCEKRIYHVYGSLGEITERGLGMKTDINLKETKLNGRPKALFIYEASKMLTSIRYNEDTEIPKKLKAMFNNTSRIYSIGFGYQLDNLKKLPIKERTPVHGSCYEIKEGEKSAIKSTFERLFKSTIKLNGDRKDIIDNLTCSQFYRSFCDLLAI